MAQERGATALSFPVGEAALRRIEHADAADLGKRCTDGRVGRPQPGGRREIRFRAPVVPLRRFSVTQAGQRIRV